MAQQPPVPFAALGPPRNDRRMMKLTRVRANAQDKTSRTLLFPHPHGAGRGNWRAGFVAREPVPQFEGQDGWFEMDRIGAKPSSYCRADRRLVSPPHA